jgi:hypothetical protein
MKRLIDVVAKGNGEEEHPIALAVKRRNESRHQHDYDAVKQQLLQEPGQSELHFFHRRKAAAALRRRQRRAPGVRVAQHHGSQALARGARVGGPKKFLGPRRGVWPQEFEWPCGREDPPLPLKCKCNKYAEFLQWQ